MEVVGGIAAIIQLLQVSQDLYKSAHKALKLPQAFVVVGRCLPIILDTLQTCHDQLEPMKATLPAALNTALDGTIDSCDVKARELREILGKVIPPDDAGRIKCCEKAFRRPRNGTKVEEVMATITEDVRLIVDHQMVKSAGGEQLAALDEVLKALHSVKSSIPGRRRSGFNISTGGGAMTSNIESDIKQQINNNAPVNTQNFGSGKD